MIEPPEILDSLEALIRSRRSVRRFSNAPVAKATIEKLIEMAVWAPSASNKQAWRFVVFTEKNEIDQLKAVVHVAITETLAALLPPYRAGFAQYSEHFLHFAAAPVVIIPCFRSVPLLSETLDPSAQPTLFDNAKALEYQSGAISVALALQNLQLYAHAMGLGCTVMTGPLLARAALKTVVAMPENWELAAVLPLGYPSELPAAPPRKPVAQAIRWR